MQEMYKILGVSATATDEEVEIAYKKLKEKYSRERFFEGEIGNEAARKLTKIETAYNEIIEFRKRISINEGQTINNFAEVEAKIRGGNLNEAQALLDDFNDRNAEWHYLQSVVFYKKNWISESKKQLEIAVNMEPFNTKYTKAFATLKERMEYNERQFKAGNMGGGAYSDPNAQQNDRQMGGDASNCLSFCATWCCMDLMCTMCCR